MGTTSVFRQRCEAYMNAMEPSSVAIVHSPPETIRSADVHFPFRQSSDLYYLTGFREPEATLILAPSQEQDQRIVLFVRPRDPERETWDGRRAGVAGVLQAGIADVAYPNTELHQHLPKLVANVDYLYYSLGLDETFDTVIARLLARLRTQERKGNRPPSHVVDPRVVLHEMRLRKSTEELHLLRKAADITKQAHLAAMQIAAPGCTEYELEAVIHYTFRRLGGMGVGYPSIVGSGANATILHYIENSRTIQDGDLVLIDAGCEYEFYCADVTRTFPANGAFSGPQRQCYECVLQAQEAAIALARPGSTIQEIHNCAVEHLTQGMIDLGLLQGPLSECLEEKRFRRYYMHSTSHWLGMDVHDVGAYSSSNGPRSLEPGMVITVEPGLYIHPEDEQAPPEFRGIGIRIEDDIVITREGNENLTESIPKRVKDVERACCQKAPFDTSS